MPSASMYDPNVIVRATEDWPEPGPFVGREAVMRQGEQLRETWDAVTSSRSATSSMLATELP